MACGAQDPRAGFQLDPHVRRTDQDPLFPAFGTNPVRPLTYDQLRLFFTTTLPAEGLGPDLICQRFTCLRSAIDHCLQNGRLTTHPMLGLKPPAKKSKTIESTKAIRRASKFLGKYLMVEARKADQEARWFCGLLDMRQDEVLGMTDDSLDGARPEDRGRRIIVKQQLQQLSAEHGCALDHGTGRWSCGQQATNCLKRVGETWWVLQCTKTESSYREIVISEDARRTLIEDGKKQEAR